MVTDTALLRLRRPFLHKVTSDLIVSVNFVLVMILAVALIDLSISFKTPNRKGLSLWCILMGIAAGAAAKNATEPLKAFELFFDNTMMQMLISKLSAHSNISRAGKS